MAFSLPSLACRRFLGATVHSHHRGITQWSPTFPFSASPSRGISRFQHTSRKLNLSSPFPRTTCNNGGTGKRGLNLNLFVKGATIAGVGLGLASLQKPPIRCDAAPTPPANQLDPIYPNDKPPPPSSSVSLYELGFGTVAGLCAGVFVKKGAMAVAWFLGGIFVLLQYLGSASLVRVDWGRAASKFENLFYTKDASGATKPPNVLSLWTWTMNFLTADFQPRASFIAGFALGLRIG
ncbi:hypothetical protein GALMADRAFT_134946 [Galerina marginata CBS 339.88]|uniref:FUN14 domain-containing protein n=1 Tax=Galerina marginata (strain CBS 339.88) TaxID=685588 RepID=A0A067TE87_GALM3|nr:hypothetical protein GALMADRAFT_134946 [Galerina marginata CBS 339.88]